MMALSEERFHTLCQQAALSVQDAQKKMIQQDLSQILQYVQSIFELGTATEVEAKTAACRERVHRARADRFLSLREDIPALACTRDDVLGNSSAADTTKGFFCVPKFVTTSS